MNNLELNKFGVQELDEKDVMSLEGGVDIVVDALLSTGWYLLKEMYRDPKQFLSSGWNSTPYGHYGGARP